MDKYPRTHLGVLLMMAALSLPLSAQTRNTGTNSAQAVLHIRVNIVPALLAAPPPVESKIPPIGLVSYNLPAPKSNVEMTEETHSLFVQSAGKPERVEGAILKTLTITPR